MGKTALGGDIVVCGDLSYNSLIESEDSVSQQQSLFLLDRFNFVSAISRCLDYPTSKCKLWC